MNSFNWQIPARETNSRPLPPSLSEAPNNPWAAIAFALIGFIIGFAVQSFIGS